jgi:hypothetical protein
MLLVISDNSDYSFTTRSLKYKTGKKIYDTGKINIRTCEMKLRHFSFLYRPEYFGVGVVLNP